MDNIGPIVLFILYMVISAWAKQKKARRKSADREMPEPAAGRQQAPVREPPMSSIFEQLKQELFAVDDEPLIAVREEAASEPEPAIVTPVETVSPAFQEGSDSLDIKTVPEQMPESTGSGRSLADMLKPYAALQQGIILHEIIGKPRALQENEEWFHQS